MVSYNECTVFISIGEPITITELSRKPVVQNAKNNDYSQGNTLMLYNQ